MPSFLSTLTVPRGTSLDAPASQSLEIVPGTLDTLRLFVPPGPRGEVYLRLRHGGVQLAPARAGTWWRPDNAVIAVPLGVQVGEGDAIIYLDGASPGANFEHSIIFEAIVLPGGSTLSSSGLVGLVKKLGLS